MVASGPAPIDLTIVEGVRAASSAWPPGFPQAARTLLRDLPIGQCDTSLALGEDEVLRLHFPQALDRRHGNAISHGCVVGESLFNRDGKV